MTIRVWQPFNIFYTYFNTWGRKWMICLTYVLIPENKVYVANMGPTWVLSAPDWPHDGRMNFAIRYAVNIIYSHSGYPVAHSVLSYGQRLVLLTFIDSNLTGDPLHSRAACTQPCNVNTHSRAHCSPGHGCVNNGSTAVSTMGHGCVQVPGCVEGHPWISTWISNHMPSKVGDEITYPFPNINIYTIEVWECIRNFILHIIMDVVTAPCWD